MIKTCKKYECKVVDCSMNKSIDKFLMLVFILIGAFVVRVWG